MAAGGRSFRPKEFWRIRLLPDGEWAQTQSHTNSTCSRCSSCAFPLRRHFALNIDLVNGHEMVERKVSVRATSMSPGLSTYWGFYKGRGRSDLTSLQLLQIWWVLSIRVEETVLRSLAGEADAWHLPGICCRVNEAQNGNFAAMWRPFWCPCAELRVMQWDGTVLLFWAQTFHIVKALTTQVAFFGLHAEPHAARFKLSSSIRMGRWFIGVILCLKMGYTLGILWYTHESTNCNFGENGNNPLDLGVPVRNLDRLQWP